MIRRRVATTLGAAMLAACTPAPQAGGAPTAAASASATAATVPPGALGVYLTISRGRETDSVLVGGQRYVLESDRYNVFAVVPETGMLTQIDRTVSASYAKSYIYPVTDAGRLFVVHTGTETGTKRVRALDPRTNAALYECSFTSSDGYRAFAIVGERLYYRTPIATDLLGRYRGGGELVERDLACLEPARTVLPHGAPANRGSLMSAGGQLFTAERAGATLEVRRIDAAASGVAWSLNADRIAYSPFEGDDGIYVAGVQDGRLVVARLPAAGGALEGVGAFPLATKLDGIHIDAADSDVYVAYADPEPHFYVVRGGEQQRLELDRSLWSDLIYGGGQILRFR